MLRFVLGMVCGSVLALAAFSSNASAQRPAAWDTRVVRSPAPTPTDPQADKKAQERQEQNEKTKTSVDPAVSAKNKKAKVN